MANWYLRTGTSIGWNNVTAWAASGAKSAGNLVRQLAAPTAGSERVFVALTAGTTAGSEPTWVITKGAKTTDNTITWQEVTGQAPVNGDNTNTPAWLAVKNTAVALGVIIKNAANSHYFICSTAGTAGNGAEPTWNTTAGVTTTDNTITWTCIGTVGSFGNWAAPFAKLAAVIAATWAAAGDNVFVGADHIETTTTSVAYNAGSATSPMRIICIPTATIPPTAPTTGAVINNTSTAGTSLTFGSVASSALRFYGLRFNAGTGATAANIVQGGVNVAGVLYLFEQCIFAIATTNAGTRISLGSAVTSQGHLFYHRKCTFLFGAAGQGFVVGQGFRLEDCAVATSGSVPTILFNINNLIGAGIIKDCDLSAVTGTLFSQTSGSTGIITVQNCRLGSGVTVVANPTNSPGDTLIQLYSSDNGAANYRLYAANFMGTQQTSIAIYRAGSLAFDGTNNFSTQIVSTANAKFQFPYESQEMLLWNDTINVARTITGYLTSATAGLTNADIWLSVEYLGQTGNPMATVDISTRCAPLATAVALNADLSTWTGGLGNNYQIAVTFTPRIKGPIRVRYIVARASLTLNADLPSLT